MLAGDQIRGPEISVSEEQFNTVSFENAVGTDRKGLGKLG
jgi:hypothetical protein